MRVRSLLVSFLVGSLAATLLPVARAPQAHAQEPMLGIDVSHHQGSVDWVQVADSGHVYAFHKATEGATFVDPNYEQNRAGAGAAGIAFGAYHFAFAQGDTLAAARADAVSEANHFLAIADPAPGDLVPVLDLEKNPQNMPPARLIAWTQAWLDIVNSTLNVRPLIYTNPNFWANHLNDTTTFADQGFPLWIAHYTSAASPRLPASDWSGRGWAFWQWTSCASIPGISGCVDENRYEGVDLSPYVIPGEPEPEPSPEPATPPSNQSPPEVSGTAEVGRTLSASQGTWTGSQPISYSFAWFRCAGSTCEPVVGGTEPTYELKPSDFGHQMQVTVTATNSAGSAEATSAPSSVVTDTTAPASPAITKPRRAKLLAARVRVAWEEVEPDAVYEVRYREAPHGAGFGDTAQLVSGSERTARRLRVTPGSTYCFSARATDTAGNTSEWSSDRCTVVALDDRSLRRSSGWKLGTGRRFYMGTFSKATRRNASLTGRGARVREISLVVQRCPNCGRVAVLFNGTRIGTVSLRARTIQNERILQVADLGRVRRGTLKIVVLSRGAPVKIDGLALVR
ncbi:MAG TPA: GH25 family lysozyme [Actinomycetota bacterium]|nr:GH25 family lysozyme [Actinomycetota bacterium]